MKKPKVPKVIHKPLKGAGNLASKGASKLPKNLPKRARKTTEEKVSEALSNVPRITNETVSEHREEVLSSARKYIYPLEHSKHRVVRITVMLLVSLLVLFVLFCGISLYKTQATGAFIYDVTRIIPFPVAKASGSWVSYESYLFELRRNMHYYQTQQQANFSTKEGKAQLNRLKTQAMDQVIEDAYIKQLADQNHLSVSDRSVDSQVELVRSQNRLGSNDRVFKNVLNEYWGWSESDFKRELKQQMLAQVVVAKLDTATNARATSALNQLNSGADFAKLAGEISDDPLTKGSGGQYPSALSPTNKDIPPNIASAVFSLKKGEISGIVNSGYSLEILKAVDINGVNVQAAHIQFNLKSINVYTDPLLKKSPPHRYIKI